MSGFLASYLSSHTGEPGWEARASSMVVGAPGLLVALYQALELLAAYKVEPEEVKCG